MPEHSAPPEIDILKLVQFYQRTQRHAEDHGLSDGELAYLNRAMARYRSKPDDARYLAGTLVNTDMVDFDYVSAKITSQSQLYAAFKATWSENPLVARIRDCAVSLPLLKRHPEIQKEFAASLEIRTLYWAPVFECLITDLHISIADDFVRLIAAWFVLVHISGPADHWIDKDPISVHWEELGFLSGFNFILQLKDQALHNALSVQHPSHHEIRASAARAVLCLSNSAITVSLANSIDASGGIDLDLSKPGHFRAKAATYERLVQWKSAEIYRVMFEAIAVYSACPVDKVDALARFGQQVGMCIQLLDDVGGIWETGQDLQKPVTKMSFPLAFVLNCESANRPEIIEHLSRPADQRDVALLQHQFTAAGAREFVSIFLEERRLRCASALTRVSEKMSTSLLDWFDDYFCGFRNDRPTSPNGQRVGAT